MQSDDDEEVGITATAREKCVDTVAGENENENGAGGPYESIYEYEYSYEKGQYRYEYTDVWIEEVDQGSESDPEPGSESAVAGVDASSDRRFER